MNEIWKDIIGFEGLYQISNYGRVKSMAKEYWLKRRIKPETIIKNKENVNGYLFVGLCKNSFYHYKTIHRLVAIHFIPNVKNKPLVNHKDGNPLNNFHNNLEWCDQNENMAHSYYSLGKKYHINKPILQLSMNGEVIQKWDSLNLAIRGNGFKSKTAIWQALHSKSHYSLGYKWYYE